MHGEKKHEQISAWKGVVKVQRKPEKARLSCLYGWSVGTWEREDENRGNLSERRS